MADPAARVNSIIRSSHILDTLYQQNGRAAHPGGSQDALAGVKPLRRWALDSSSDSMPGASIGRATR